MTYGTFRSITITNETFRSISKAYEMFRSISMTNGTFRNISMAYGPFRSISKNEYEIEAQTSYPSIVHVWFNSVVAPHNDEFSTPSMGSRFLLDPSDPAQVLGRL